MEKRDILVIFGPTASGKSKLATQIASKHKSAIINFDSLQVYKDLKILTDRPDDEICKKFDHRLYGILKGSESCSAAIWLEKAEHEINNCFDNKLLPIVVGGTGLYLKALMDGLSEIPSVKKNIEERLNPEFEGRFKIMLVPNVTNICYGRGVGYKIEEIVLPEEIQKISATKIRAKMREEGKLK